MHNIYQHNSTTIMQYDVSTNYTSTVCSYEYHHTRNVDDPLPNIVYTAIWMPGIIVWPWKARSPHLATLCGDHFFSVSVPLKKKCITLCVYIRACAPASQRGMRIHTQLRSDGLVRMSIAIEEAPDDHRRQLHPYLPCSSCN